MSLLSLPRTLLRLQRFDFPHKLGICERLFGGALSSLGTGWVKTGAGITWKLDLTNPTHRWVVYGKYEGRAFLDWAREFLPSDGVVVDSGANIGQMLIYLAQYVPQGKVLAFEPGRHQADWLEECLSVHEHLPAELLRRGLGEASAKLFLHNPGPVQIHGAWNQVSEKEGEPIEVVRLADVLKSRSITKIDLWKLDVEVYEVPALRGAEELLSEKRIRALYVELSGDNGPRVREYLAPFGYSCYLFNKNGKVLKPTELPEHTNGLFLPD
jgi:FkbM family methyltransferase